MLLKPLFGILASVVGIISIVPYQRYLCQYTFAPQKFLEKEK